MVSYVDLNMAAAKLTGSHANKVAGSAELSYFTEVPPSLGHQWLSQCCELVFPSMQISEPSLGVSPLSASADLTPIHQHRLPGGTNPFYKSSCCGAFM